MEQNLFTLKDNSKLDHRSLQKWLHGFIMSTGGEKVVRGDMSFRTAGVSHSENCAIYTVEIRTEKPGTDPITNFIIDYKFINGHPIVDINYLGELQLPLARVHGVKLSCADGLPYNLKFGEVISTDFRNEPQNYSEFIIFDEILSKLERTLESAGLKTREVIIPKKSEEKSAIAALFGLRSPLVTNPV